eukprot:gene25852-biopygen9448
MQPRYAASVCSLGIQPRYAASVCSGNSDHRTPSPQNSSPQYLHQGEQGPRPMTYTKRLMPWWSDVEHWHGSVTCTLDFVPRQLEAEKPTP